MAHSPLARVLRIFPLVRALETERDALLRRQKELVSAGDQLAKDNADLLVALKRAQDDVARIVAGEMTLEGLAMENGTLTVELGTQMTHYLAAVFGQVLREKGGENYVEMTFSERPQPVTPTPDNPDPAPEPPMNIAVTIRRYEKLSPHQLRAQAEGKLAECRQQLHRVLALWGVWKEEALNYEKSCLAVGNTGSAERHRMVANTYTTCESNLEEAMGRVPL